MYLITLTNMFQNGCAGIPAKLLTMRTSEDSSSTFMLFNNTDRSHVLNEDHPNFFLNKELAHAWYWHVFLFLFMLSRVQDEQQGCTGVLQ